MEWYYWIVLIIGVGVIVFAFLRWHKTEAKNDGDDRFVDVKRRATNIQNRMRVGQGWKLWAEPGVTVTEDKVQAIEAGILYCIEKARAQPGYAQHPEWPRATDLSRWNVALFGNVMRSPEGKVWSWKIPTPSNYVGSQWDVNGSFLVAGQTIEEDGEFGVLIALPDHPTGWNGCQCAVHEAEHVILRYVDSVKWAVTATHRDGTGHPLIPDIAKPVGIAAIRTDRQLTGFCGGAGPEA